MEFAINLGIAGAAILVVGALVFGAAAQLFGTAGSGFEWLIDAIAAGVGGLAASEFVTAWRTVEPTVDGLAIVPALIGGVVVGLIVAVATRYLTGGDYTGRSMTA